MPNTDPFLENNHDGAKLLELITSKPTESNDLTQIKEDLAAIKKQLEPSILITGNTAIALYHKMCHGN